MDLKQVFTDSAVDANRFEKQHSPRAVAANGFEIYHLGPVQKMLWTPMHLGSAIQDNTVDAKVFEACVMMLMHELLLMPIHLGSLLRS